MQNETKCIIYQFGDFVKTFMLEMVKLFTCYNSSVVPVHWDTSSGFAYVRLVVPLLGLEPRGQGYPRCPHQVPRSADWMPRRPRWLNHLKTWLMTHSQGVHPGRLAIICLPRSSQHHSLLRLYLRKMSISHHLLGHHHKWCHLSLTAKRPLFSPYIHLIQTNLMSTNQHIKTPWT